MCYRHCGGGRPVDQSPPRWIGSLPGRQRHNLPALRLGGPWGPLAPLLGVPCSAGTSRGPSLGPLDPVARRGPRLAVLLAARHSHGRQAARSGTACRRSRHGLEVPGKPCPCGHGGATAPGRRRRLWWLVFQRRQVSPSRLGIGGGGHVAPQLGQLVADGSALGPCPRPRLASTERSCLPSCAA